MTQEQQRAFEPTLAIPEPLYGREPDTWQHLTITERQAETAERVIAEGQWTARQISRLRQLIVELPNGSIRPLVDPQAPDAAAWNDYVMPYVGLSWLNVPWFFAEMYFFRRILEATGYFGPGAGEGVDPYAHQKRAGLMGLQSAVDAMTPFADGDYSSATLRRLLVLDLWGNQADMSIWPASTSGAPEKGAATPDRAHLLIDQTAEAVEYVAQATARGPIRFDFLIDNAGIELVGDLVTADYLLRHAIARVIRMHVKPYPTFVSDATLPDVVTTIEALAGSGDEQSQMIGRRLWRALADGRINLQPNTFWTSPRAFWEMPFDLRAELEGSDLMIVKGDMNYRRLHGDRHWPYDTPFAAIVRGTPAPLLCLRVIKAEVASGLSREVVMETVAADPEWMTDGRWGMAPFFGG